MGALKKLNEIGSEPFSQRYSGVPVVYVESTADEYIFSNWFKHYLGKVEIKPADQHCSAGGCNAVVGKVLEERSNQNEAWGVVDRDTVMKDDHWHLVWETNDKTFEKTQPYGNFIKILRRWEIENYLIDAESLEDYRSAHQKAPPKPAAAVWQELHKHCDALVPVIAYNAMCHASKVAGTGDGFANQQPDRAAVMTEVQSKLLLNHPPSRTNEFLQNIPKAEAFDQPNSDHQIRVEGLLRIIPGKAILLRFRKSAKIHDEIDGQLTQKILEKGRIPSEIDDFFRQVTA